MFSKIVTQIVILAMLAAVVCLPGIASAERAPEGVAVEDVLEIQVVYLDVTTPRLGNSRRLRTFQLGRGYAVVWQVCADDSKSVCVYAQEHRADPWAEVVRKPRVHLNSVTYVTKPPAARN